MLQMLAEISGEKILAWFWLRMMKRLLENGRIEIFHSEK
jgi:hypothetical protein